MKKQIVAIVLIAGLSLATVASANWGRGGHGYGGNGNCPLIQGTPMMQAPMMQQLDADTQAKITQFFKDNQALHKQMAMKRAEKQALMQSDKPDSQAVAKVTGELFDLRTSLQEKAEAAGVSQYVMQMGQGMGRGMGMGMGPGGRGFAQ